MFRLHHSAGCAKCRNRSDYYPSAVAVQWKARDPDQPGTGRDRHRAGDQAGKGPCCPGGSGATYCEV